MRLRLALTFVLLLVATPEALGQRWQAYPAFRDIRAVAASGEAVWAATPAGVFSYTPADGSFTRYSPIDGLRGGEVSALAVDDAGRVWVGYTDGALDRIDPATDEIRTFFEIARADQYASRGVNRIRPRGDRLLVATDFGLVVFDTAREEVRQTAARLGPLPAATPVRDALVAPAPDGSGTAIWLATDGGIVWAPEAAENIQIPTLWTLDPGFDGAAYALAAYEETVWAGGRLGSLQRGDLYKRRPAGDWERMLFLDERITDLLPTDGVLAAAEQDGGRTFLVETGVGTSRFDARPLAVRLQSIARGPDGRLWAGDRGVGLFPYPEIQPGTTGAIPVVPDPRLPAGPFANAILSTDLADDGAIWTASGAIAVGVAGTAAVSALRDGAWTTLRTDQTALPDRGLRVVVARPQGGAFVGSDGGGLAIVEASGAITVFDETNSTLRTATGQNDFIVVEDVVPEGDGWWVLNTSSPFPLHLFPGTPEATPADWVGLPPPPGGPSGVPGFEMVLDRFGQKWIAMGERGLLVWDTGADPRSPADDRGRTFSTGFNGQGLPNGTVNAVVEDREGRIWVGTSRGIAVVFSPGSAFGGDPALAEPVWPLFEGGGVTDYLLRDVDVNTLALDPAGRLWVGTTTGAYLLTPEADQIALRLDAASSPLPSDDVVDIDIDERTGLVYFTTREGLYSYAGDATGPTPGSEALTLAPNPFRPRDTPRVTIGGLNAATSRVRVLTLDGMVVYQSDSVFGGSFQWDGRDERTGDLVPSGVYLVAASGANGEETLYGKLAVVR